MSLSMYTIIVLVLSLLLLLSMQVESSRPLVHYNKVSIDQSKIVDPSNKSGIMGHVHVHTGNNKYGFKISKAYSGPSRRGIGHGLTNLLRNLSSSSSTNPFKRFKEAKYPGPSSRGTGH
ncbi:hypothetical protein CsatB_007517 [Cannabis sativa]